MLQFHGEGSDEVALVVVLEFALDEMTLVFAHGALNFAEQVGTALGDKAKAAGYERTYRFPLNFYLPVIDAGNVFDIGSIISVNRDSTAPADETHNGVPGDGVATLGKPDEHVALVVDTHPHLRGVENALSRQWWVFGTDY